MQSTSKDTKASVQAMVSARWGNHLIGHEELYTGGRRTGTEENGAYMSTSFHAEGGDTSLWLAVNEHGTNFEEVRQRWAASFAADRHDLYPWGLELRPIWEVVERVDAAKGNALREYLIDKWERQAHAFRPVNFLTSIPRAVEITGAKKWSSNGIYTRTTAQCNGRPVYRIGTGDYVLFQPLQEIGKSEWAVGWRDHATSCEATGYVHTWGLECEERPDCPGQWRQVTIENDPPARGWGPFDGGWGDAHGLAVREVHCSRVCGAHGSVVADDVTCKCSCRDGFSGPRCDNFSPPSLQTPNNRLYSRWFPPRGGLSWLRWTAYFFLLGAYAPAAIILCCDGGPKNPQDADVAIFFLQAIFGTISLVLLCSTFDF